MRHLLPLAAATSLVLAGCVVPMGQVPLGQPTAAPVTPPTIVAPVVTTGGGATTTLTAKQASVELAIGAEQQLNALVVDERGQVPTAGVIWLSSNDKVATVNPTSGQVKAIGEGTAIVTAVAQANPAAKTQIEVRVGVRDLVKAITIEPGTAKLEVGGQVTLRAAVNMADGTINGNVKWASSDSTVATVNPTTGEVTALRDGTVTIEGLFALDPRFKGVAVINIGALPASPPPGTEVPLTPGGEPGEIVDTSPKGRWIAQVVEGATQISGVWFEDEKHGLLQASEGLFATQDAGGTWTPVAATDAPQIGGGNNMGGLKWLADGTAIVPTYGDVQRSEDGGATWERVAFALPQYRPGSYNYLASATLRHVAVAADDELYAFIGTPGQYGHMLYTSADAGKTWAQETWDFFQGHLLEDLVKVGGTRLLRTNQGIYRKDGDAWAKLFPAGALTRVPGSQTVYYLGNEAVRRSDDGGTTWTVVGNPRNSAPSWSQPSTVSFSDADHGLAYDNQTAYTTNNGGKTWTDGQIPEVTRGSLISAGVRVSAERGFVVRAGQLHRFVLP